MMRRKRWHGKHQLDFALHGEQIGDMLKAKRRDRAVLPTLSISPTFPRTCWSTLEHPGRIERRQGKVLLETCKVLVESLPAVHCGLASRRTILRTALQHREFLLVRESLPLTFQQCLGQSWRSGRRCRLRRAAARECFYPTLLLYGHRWWRQYTGSRFRLC